MTEAEKERAAVVEWLRGQSAQSETPETGFVIARMALCIEECDHHKEDSKHG